MTSRRPRKTDPIQRHHLDYQEGEFGEKTGKTVKLYRSEHFLITKMQWRSKVSLGFIEALKYWISQVEKDAIDLASAGNDRKKIYRPVNSREMISGYTDLDPALN